MHQESEKHLGGGGKEGEREEGRGEERGGRKGERNREEERKNEREGEGKRENSYHNNMIFDGFFFLSFQCKSRLEKLKNQVDYHGRCKKMREKLEK